MRPTTIRRADSARPSAFTLVELLVVITIIGILAALLLPTLSKSKAQAQNAVCVNNLHQLGVAMQSFLNDYQRYPSAMDATNSDYGGRWWGLQLERVGLGVANPVPGFHDQGVWHCPSQLSLSFGPGYLPSYGFNAFGVLRIGNTNPPGLFGYLVGSNVVHIRESEVVSPSDMMAIGDSLFGSFYFMRADLADNTKWRAPSRHRGKANVLFCDSHVESPTLTRLFQDTSDAALRRWNRDHLPHRELLTP